MSTRRSLEQLRVQEPCHVSWDTMQQDGVGRRFCDQCQKHVHDLSALPRGEAERLVNCGDSVCVRMTYDARGTVVTRDSKRAGLRRGWLNRAAAVAAMLGLGSIFQAGCGKAPTTGTTEQPPQQPPFPTRTMGIVATPHVIQGDIMGEIPATTQPSESTIEQGAIAPAIERVEEPALMGRIAPPQTQPIKTLQGSLQ